MKLLPPLITFCAALCSSAASSGEQNGLECGQPDDVSWAAGVDGTCSSESDPFAENVKQGKEDGIAFFNQFLHDGQLDPTAPETTHNTAENVSAIASTHADDGSDECNDENEQCSRWAAQGECEKNPNYMMVSCKKSCSACEDDSTSSSGGVEIGVEQKVMGNRSMDTLELIHKTQAYVRDLLVRPEYESVLSKCKNHHELCSFWAVIGECETNPKYMATQCAPACQSCANFDPKVLCAVDSNAEDTWGAGDLSKMFEGIRADEGNVKYTPYAFSGPKLADVIEGEEAKPQIEGPWVMALEDFASPEECERLIELGEAKGYTRSQSVGSWNANGTYVGTESKDRTSETAWCLKNCHTDPVAVRVMDRIANLTRTPFGNSEFFQFVRYKEGQYFKRHTDYIAQQIDRQPGVRVLTFFLYLNDVEEGGETGFPELGVSIMPKRGRALVWPNVLDVDPNKKDARTASEVLPVIKGIEYGASLWIHMRDFKGPYANGCD